MTPLYVIYVLIAAIAVKVGLHLRAARRDARVRHKYLRVFEQVRRESVMTEPFIRYLVHLKSVIETRPAEEVLQFDTAPEKLLESFIKQQMRNADPEYKLFDERLDWLQNTRPPAQINLPATPWMNEFVLRLHPAKNEPAPVREVVGRLDEAIDCLRSLPEGVRLLAGASPNGRGGVYLGETSKISLRREHVRIYTMLAALWALHSALLLGHGRSWAEVAADRERLILALGPPLAGYLLMRLAYWVRPVAPAHKEAAGTLGSFLFQSSGQQNGSGEPAQAGASVSSSTGVTS
jgi:hypothetical protein